MKCPQCFKDVPINESQYLALFTCPQCYAVYFVNADGVPEYGDMTTPGSLDAADDESANLVGPGSFESPVHVHQEAVESPLNDIHLESLHSIEPSSLSLETDIDGSLNTHMYESSDQLQNDQLQNVVPLENSQVVGAGVLGAVFQDIQSYGNQDQVVANINFDLTIKNLDQKENLLLFKEAIDDSKLGWVKEDILSQINNGQCRLSKLSAVLATILIQRLTAADVDIEWVQHVETL